MCFSHIFLSASDDDMIKAETCHTLDRPICVRLKVLLIYLQFHSLHLDLPFGELRIWEHSPLKQHPVTGIRVTHDIQLYHILLQHGDAYVTDTPLLPRIHSDLHLASSVSQDCSDVCTRLTTDKAHCQAQTGVLCYKTSGVRQKHLVHTSATVAVTYWYHCGTQRNILYATSGSSSTT